MCPWTGTTYFGQARRVALPTYAFQHEYYWPLGSTAPVVDTDADPADAKLWAAIERGDARELAALLRLGEEQRSSLDSLIPALSSWRAGNQEKSLLDSWRYRVLWAPVRVTGTPVLSGHIVVVTTSSVDAEPYRAVLAAHGAEVTVVLDVADVPECDLVVSLVALDESPSPVLTAGLEQSIALVKSIEAPIWAVTSGAVAAETSDSVRSPAQAAVWGFGRAAALELPQRWAGLIDMPAVPDENALRRFVSCVAGLNGEDQLAVRSSGVLGRRLAHRPVDTLPSDYSAHGTVLITGGTGGLGATTARWLAERGVSGLVLTSRRGIDAPGAAELKASLEELGPRVSIVACDVADRDALAAVLADIPDLSGVVHTAGAAQHAPLELTSTADFAEVLSAKVIGAANLDSLVGEVDLFVLFGSIAGVWGSGGQAAYGAANAYCDALAEARRARGLRATSIAWGPWAEVGMATHEAMSDNLARRGLTFLQPGPGHGRAEPRGDARRHVRHRRGHQLGHLLPAVHLGPSGAAAVRPARGQGADGRRGGPARRLGVRTQDSVLCPKRTRSASWSNWCAPRPPRRWATARSRRWGRTARSATSVSTR